MTISNKEAMFLLAVLVVFIFGIYMLMAPQ
jgi:hypothetical protein